MSPANRMAFKEWAVVCAAIGSGRQSLILRKGGIHEGTGGFRVAHSEFWLFPTGFHQEPSVIVADAAPLLSQTLKSQPPEDQIEIQYFVQVEKVFEINEEARLSLLAPWHIWSETTVSARFHYRNPGLYALLVRAFQLPVSLCLPKLPCFAGCRSWVELPSDCSTNELQPILLDDVHNERMAQLGELLQDR